MTLSVLDQIRLARKVSTPLVLVTTADPPATVAAVVRGFAKDGTKAPPLLQHDIIRGIVGLNDEGQAARAALVRSNDGMPELPGQVPLTSPGEALTKAAELPPRALLFVHLGGRILEDVGVIQAICNLRDLFKADGRTLVILAPQATLPPELGQDVYTIDEPLPTEPQIRQIIDKEFENAASMKTPPKPASEDEKARAVEALSGLATFPVEQSIAMTLAAGALDLDALWNRKRSYISQTRGLAMENERIRFDDLGGLESSKTFGREIFAGPERPRVVVRMDEIEKMLAGAAGDTSGTSQDQLGTILREMEDNEWVGLIAVGPPGSGKSAYSKALGTSHDVPTFSFDLGAAKGSLVGQSEERIRAAMKVIKAIAGKAAYFVATCNAIEANVIKPELLRRFTDGIWFFDLPTAEEKAQIWPIALRKYGLPADMPRPTDTDWTGAEIRNCCRLAYRMRRSLADAARLIVPVAQSNPAAIDKLRTTAHLKFLSASTPGTYRHAKAPNAAAAVSAAAASRSYQE